MFFVLVVGEEVIFGEILLIIKYVTTDIVFNVRFNVVKAFFLFIKVIDVVKF